MSVLERSDRRKADRHFLRCLASLAFTALLPAVAAAQVDTLQIDDECDACDLRIAPVAVLGGELLPFDLSSASEVAVMSDGTFLVAPTMEPGQIAVFDSRGDFVRVVGRSGDGPGEFGRVRTVLVGPGDTVRVLEYGEVTILAPDFTYVRHGLFNGPAPDAWTVLPTNELVVLGTAMGTGIPGDRLHVVGVDGSYVRSFARAPRAYEHERDIDERWGTLSPAYEGLWFAKAVEYRLERYEDEQLVAIVTRDVPWFERWREHRPLEAVETRPRAAIESVAEQANGEVLVVIREADRNWEENRRSIERGREGPNVRSLDRRAIFDTRMEVLDLENERVTGATVSDDYLRVVQGSDDLLFGPRLDAVGRVYLHIFRLEVDR